MVFLVHLTKNRSLPYLLLLTTHTPDRVLFLVHHVQQAVLLHWERQRIGDLPLHLRGSREEAGDVFHCRQEQRHALVKLGGKEVQPNTRWSVQWVRFALGVDDGGGGAQWLEKEAGGHADATALGAPGERWVGGGKPFQC